MIMKQFELTQDALHIILNALKKEVKMYEDKKNIYRTKTFADRFDVEIGKLKTLINYLEAEQ